MKNKKFKFWIVGSSIFFLSIFAFFSPIWYDDACHSLVILGILNTGQESFPTGNNTYFTDSLLITVGPIWNGILTLWSYFLSWNLYLLRIPTVIISTIFLYFIYQNTENQFNKNRGIFAFLFVFANIQFLTYGSQVLGEVPAMFFICLSLKYLSDFLANFTNKNLFFAVLFANLAILTKEYIALPIGLTFFILLFQIPKEKSLFFMISGISLLLGPIFYYYLKFSSLESFIEFWNLKLKYSEEFFNSSGEGLRFILFKPLISLGFLASWIQFLFHYSKPQLPYFIFFNIQLILFLIGAGYDRFAIFLIPISAFYLADWAHFFWKNSKNQLKKSLFVCVFSILFVQNSVFKIFYLLSKNKNHLELEIVDFIKKENKPAFSFELNIVAFAPNLIQTSGYPPCLNEIQPQMELKPQTLYIFGPYSDTEFIHKLDESRLKIVYKNDLYRVGIIIQ